MQKTYCHILLSWNGLEYSLHLFESITHWAQEHDLEMGTPI